MPKKLTILGALTVAVVIGYMGLFAGSDAQAGGQTFGISPASAAVSVDQCYDTNFLNSPKQALPTGGAVNGRVACNVANPATLPVNVAVKNWTVINLPPGNRLTLPATFTPSGAGEWQIAAVPCSPGANNECTDTDPWPAGSENLGDITSRTDIGCNAPTWDILGATGGANNLGNNDWANETNESETSWPMPNFDRLAAAAALGGADEISGGDNAYIHDTVPFPTTGVNAWDFRSSDLSVLTKLYLVGLPASVDIPPTKLNLVTYASAYAGQTGLNASVALLGGSPDTPANDSLLTCALQSPQDSVSETDLYITPNTTRRIVRWTILTSDYDRFDAQGPNFEDDDLNRILDWDCTLIGVDVAAVNAAAGVDNDGDCVGTGDTDDTPVTGVDDDGDKVPDGVELEYNSSPTDTDTDNDNCDDYCEIFSYTDPNDTDSDNDGQADKPDDTPTQKVGAAEAGDDAPTTGTDALDLTDDNCPAVANADQLNTDSRFQFHGMGVGTGDATNPDEDADGDACDSDADNDGIPGATEPLVRIKDWNGYGGPQTSVCVGVANTPNQVPDNALLDTKGDTDFDYVLDGQECIYRSRPDQSVRGTCSGSACVGIALDCSTGTAPVLGAGNAAEGCAQPGIAAHLTNSDGAAAVADGLYLPGAPQNNQIEQQFRAMNFNLASGTNDKDTDNDGADGDLDKDSDGDILGAVLGSVNLQDGPEVWVYGTFASDTDSDQDGCPDGDEVNDINGDGTSNSGDQGLMVSKIALGVFDNNNDGNLSEDYVAGINSDLNKLNTTAQKAQVNSGDQGNLSATITATGSCQVAAAYLEDNIDVTNFMSLP